VLNDLQHQEDVLRFLRRVVEGHATNPMLFVGVEGVGRRFAALQVAKELFCTGGKTSDCPCADCVQISQSVHPDLLYVAPSEGKDIGIEAIRGALGVIDTYPTQAPLRVIVLDGADRLTLPAANALLKTLEEPPSTVRIFLLAEVASRVLPTIRSRCGVLNFRPLPESFIQARVQEFESSVEKALVYARLGEGSVGRAIQYWGSGRLALRDKALTLLSYALSKDTPGVFLLLDQLEKDLPLTLLFLNTLTHDLIMLGVASQRIVNLDVEGTLRKMHAPAPDTWQRLHQGIETMLATYRATKIQLAFHAKTLLLETFVGG